MVLIKSLLGHQIGELKVHILWEGSTLFQKLPYKISTLNSPIWIGGRCHQERECAVKILV